MIRLKSNEMYDQQARPGPHGKMEVGKHLGQGSPVEGSCLLDTRRVMSADGCAGDGNLR